MIRYDAMRQFIQRIVGELGLEPSAYGTHSPRHGAVVEMLLEGKTTKEIANYGDWKSESAVEAYSRPYNPDLVKFVPSAELYFAERRKRNSSKVLIAGYDTMLRVQASTNETGSTVRVPKNVYRYVYKPN